MRPRCVVRRGGNEASQRGCPRAHTRSARLARLTELPSGGVRGIATGDTFRRLVGPEAWCGEKPLPERGFVALGTPIGAPAFAAACARERL